MANSSRTSSKRPDILARWLHSIALSAALSCVVFGAQSSGFEIGGHMKHHLTYTSFPDESLFRSLAGSSAEDFAFDARMNLRWRSGSWDMQADAQFAALYGDSIDFTRNLSGDLQSRFSRLPSDDRRLFNLTHIIADENKRAALIRLDRLSVGYTGDRGVIRFGRQAVTWGNGLIFNTVMDIFNPFDPTSIDKEYKSGDDMLYGQYLRDNGDDIQAVLVFRRDPMTGELEADQSSIAGKYHGFFDAGEYDVVAARHFGENLVGFGGNRTVWGDALWRGDFVATFTDDDRVVASAVTSLSHSFVLGDKNVSAVVEYYFNGFGQRDGRYATDALQSNQNLLDRVARGEIFNLGRHYIGLSTLIEVTPLFLFTPNVFANVEDKSALVQFSAQIDVQEDILLLGSLNIPVGPTGTEFGGIEPETSGMPLSSGPSLFVQLASYF